MMSAQLAACRRPWKIAGLAAVVTAVLCGAAPSSAEKEHWAFRRLVRPPVPRPARAEKARTAVDGFVLTALEKKNLSLGAAADRATLLRRLTFDLIGLPSTPAEIERFVG